ncbi:hypothetical protein [Arthrobacter oryzae]|uniref:DUF7793 domain-containing protein n=1 Tax=Arthrobacter oryzae TaxID=409290 RepID=A0A495FN54_9MICC|nr:hypothetical protein [Arthrobacter oryzae]RKR30161.1 hypothetical protein C8D78_0481 [Arthrobacter oryzae]
MTTLFEAEDVVHSPAGADLLSYRPKDGPASPGSGPANVTVENTGEGIVRITLRPGSRISLEDGIRVREQYLASTGGAGAAVLLQITGVESVSRDAFRFFSEASTITAFAILGSTSVDRVIAHGRRGLPLPQCPSEYFSDEQDALVWLRDLTTAATA